MRGSIMIELIVALAIYALALTSVALLDASGATAPEDLQNERKAMGAVRDGVSDAEREAALDWSNLSATHTISATTSSWDRATTFISPCVAEAAISSSYRLGIGLMAKVTAETYLANPVEGGMYGDDCDTAIPQIQAPVLTNDSFLNAASTTAVDSLNGTAYVGTAQPPYFAEFDLRSGTAAELPFTNNFALPSAPNDLDAIRWQDSAGWHITVYAALASSTDQFAVIDATTQGAPVLSALMPLAGVDPAGSYPEGWRVRYYDGRIYVVTRETLGPEFHSFDANDPLHPQEIGSGVELGITFNDFAFENLRGDGVSARYLFAATDRADGELEAFNATEPGILQEIRRDRTDLDGLQNGLSVYALGPTLFLGRSSVPSGQDLFAFDISRPESGLPLLGSAEVGSGVSEIVVWGSYAFLETPKAGRQFQVWNIADPAHMRAISTAPALMPMRGFDLDGSTPVIAGSVDARHQLSPL